MLLVDECITIIVYLRNDRCGILTDNSWSWPPLSCHSQAALKTDKKLLKKIIKTIKLRSGFKSGLDNDMYEHFFDVEYFTTNKYINDPFN